MQPFKINIPYIKLNCFFQVRYKNTTKQFHLCKRETNTEKRLEKSYTSILTTVTTT